MSDQKPAEPISADDFRTLQAQMREQQIQVRKQNEQIAALANRNAELQKELAGNVLPEDERPAYELAQPWMSPDDVYYPEGVQFVDVCGDIIPNEFMIPLNGPAQVRYDSYMASLPLPGRQPTISDMIDVTAKVIRELGADVPGNQIAQAVAAALAGAHIGGKHSVATPSARVPVRGDVPLMANTRITQGAGGAPLPPLPGRKPARTKQVGQAPASLAPVLGSVQTPPLATQPS